MHQIVRQVVNAKEKYFLKEIESATPLNIGTIIKQKQPFAGMERFEWSRQKSNHPQHSPKPKQGPDSP